MIFDRVAQGYENAGVAEIGVQPADRGIERFFGRSERMKAAVSNRGKAMRSFGEYAEPTPANEEFFELANLSPRTTGLPFVVWISPKAGAQHDVRVKVSRGPRVHPTDLVTVAIRPDVRVVGGKMSAQDLTLLRKWVELNRDVIIGYWDGDIEYTEDAIAALRPLPD